MAVNWRMQGNLKLITVDIKKKRPKATVYGVGDASHQSRTSDHNPFNWGYGIVVSAIDVMIRNGLTKADGDAIVKELRGRSDIQYLIWCGYIYSASWGWKKRKYNGKDPHTDHVHISAKHTRAADKDTRGLPGFAGRKVISRPVKAKPAQPVKSVPAKIREKAPAFPLSENAYFQVSGAKKKAVALFQAELKQRGWKIDVDGIFGADTEEIVKQFQKEKGLARDGKVGPNTWRAIWESPVSK